MGQNNKVKDTNNRNARVIYDAKEVINGLQAPIVKDAEVTYIRLFSMLSTNFKISEILVDLCLQHQSDG